MGKAENWKLLEACRVVEASGTLMVVEREANARLRAQLEAVGYPDWWRERLSRAHDDGCEERMKPPHRNRPWQRLSMYDINLMAAALSDKGGDDG